MHLEMQDLKNRNWIYNGNLSDYLNPAEFMGFPNIEDISVIYKGTPIPPIPINIQKNKFKWVLYSRRIRNRNNF